MKYSLDSLIKSNLIVKPTGNFGSYKNGYFIAKRVETADKAHHIFFFDEDIENGIPIEESNSCYIHPINNKWIFNHWIYVPGPGPEDIEFEANSFEEVVEITLNFCFGQTTIINGWIFPLNRHPDWNINEINKQLQNLQYINQATWCQIYEDISKYYNMRWKAKLWPLTFAEHCQNSFVTIYNESTKTVCLKLRRDLKLAYIISDWTSDENMPD